MSSTRAFMAKTIWKSIQARLAWRETPTRALDDKTRERRGQYTLERIINYAKDGYVPFWMQKGAVDPWVPKARWDTPSRKQVKDTPKTEWFMWIAGVIDEIERVGRVQDFKAERRSIEPLP